MVAVNAVVEAVVRVLCPVTESVPLEVNDEVAVRVPMVAVPPVMVEKTLVTALNTLATRLETVVVARVVLPVNVLLPAML